MLRLSWPIYLALILFVVAFQSCESNNKKEPFVIAGKILHASGHRLIIEELPLGGKSPIAIDSTTLKSKGDFRMKFFCKDEGIYQLDIENGPKIVLINDSDSILVNLDAEHFIDYTTQGSKATTDLHNFLLVYVPEFEKLNDQLKNKDTAGGEGILDSTHLATMRETNLSLQKINDTINSYLAHTESPSLTYYLLAKSLSTMDLMDVNDLIQTSMEKFPKHEGLKYLSSVIEVQVPRYLLLGTQAPQIALKDTSGQIVSLDSLRGNYVLVDFWASWCQPCRQENPNVRKAWGRFKDKNFKILGVSLDKSKKAWQYAIEDDKLEWLHVSDFQQWESPLVGSYHFFSIPFNVLVDPKGKIIAYGLRGKRLEKVLEKVLK